MTEQSWGRLEDVHLWTGLRRTEPGLVSAFREEVRRSGAPHHLAKYDHGVYEFSVDVLGDAELFHGNPDADPERRPFFRAVGQQMAFMMSALDQQLAELDTGRLIRMVLHTERGALFCLSITPKNYVLAIAFGAAAARPGRPPLVLPRVPLVRDADRFASGLTDAIRDQMGLPSQNPGGWQTARPTLEAPYHPARDLEVSGPDHRAEMRHWSMGDAAIEERLLGILDPAELIYLAHSHSGQLTTEADLLGHAEVAAVRSARISADAARAAYRRLAEEFAAYTRQLSQLARQAMRGRMLRIVLDVEQGALFYYRLGAKDYLVGVTTNQKRVEQSDERLGELVAELVGSDSAFGN